VKYFTRQRGRWGNSEGANGVEAIVLEDRSCEAVGRKTRRADGAVSAPGGDRAGFEPRLFVSHDSEWRRVEPGFPIGDRLRDAQGSGSKPARTRLASKPTPCAPSFSPYRRAASISTYATLAHSPFHLSSVPPCFCLCFWRSTKVFSASGAASVTAHMVRPLASQP
jgi:hypothetical protein